MTPQEAINILDVLTQPSSVGRLTRQDYVNADTALRVLVGVVNAPPAVAPEMVSLPAPKIVKKSATK